MKRLAVLLLLALLLAVPGGVVLAAPHFDTVVEADEVINNDVIVFDGDLEIEAGAVVNGDVIVFNGDVRLDGAVNGDIVLFNGNLEARETAVVSGECVLLNGALRDASAAGLRCTNVENLNLPGFFGRFPNMAGSFVERDQWMPGRMTWSAHAGLANFFGGLFQTIVSSLLFGLLAFVVASVLPDQLRRVQATVQQKPVASGVVGLLTAVAVPSLAALLVPVSIVLTFVCIGLLGFPIILVLLVGLVAAALLGWIALGTWLGERLAGPLQMKQRRLAGTAAIGTALLTFIFGLLGLIPFVFGEGLLTALALCVGLGAVALTQFGGKPYPRAAAGDGVQVDADKVTAVLETLPDDADDFSLRR